ncbi:hypothetical protein KI387_001977, partial [Taxus chinensis]
KGPARAWIQRLDTIHREGLESRGRLRPHDKVWSSNSHTQAGNKLDLCLEGNAAMKEGELALTTIIVLESQHHEVIIDHCLVNIDDISTCDEPRVENKNEEQEGEEKGMVGNQFPNRHDDNKLAGLFRTAVPKEHNDDGLDISKSYDDIPNTHEQGMAVVHPSKQPPSHACIKTK